MPSPTSGSTLGLEENLKRAVTEMMVLALLRGEDMYAAQITRGLEERSGGTLSIVFPYAALYRLINCGYTLEAYKKAGPDRRRRQYYQITEKGRDYLDELVVHYRRFSAGVEQLLETQGGAEE